MVQPSFHLGSGHGGGLASPDGLRPREWQSRMIQLLRARLVQGGPASEDVLIHAGPGAGKTLGALLGFQRLFREGRLERFMVFCHRQSIAQQWQRGADRLALPLRAWEPSQASGEVLGLLISYQAAARHRLRLELELEHHFRDARWLAIADEVHHLGLDPDEPEATAWGHAFSRLTQASRLRLGLSGTPFRADNLAFCAARRIREVIDGQPAERIIPDLCVEPRSLIRAGDVRPLEFRFQDGWVEHGLDGGAGERQSSTLSEETRESWRARNLRRAIRLGDGGGIGQRVLLQARRRLERVRHGHAEAAGLVIARDIDHARSITALLREQGERVQLVHSQDPGAAKHLSAFQAGDGDWLVSVDMCAEGFDAPRLRIVAYLTTVVTRGRFVQGITRAVRMDARRTECERIPRHPSYVFAPADPLLISHARSWSLSEPYVIRMQNQDPAVGGGGAVSAGGVSPRAIADTTGAVIRLGGPQLPDFAARSA